LTKLKSTSTEDWNILNEEPDEVLEQHRNPKKWTGGMH